MTIQNDLLTDDKEMFLVSGTLAELQVARTTVNLLERLQQRQQAGNLVTGAAAVVGDMHGLVATSASLAFYDGEDAFNFAAILGNDVICGVFDSADKLVEGDQITAVVSRRGDVLYCHSLRRESDQLWLLPISVAAGRAALFRNCMRSAWRGCVGLWVFFLLAYVISSLPELQPPKHLVIPGLMFLLFPPAIAYPLEWSTYRTVKGLGEYASKIFHAYGIANPDDFDASSGLRSYPDPVSRFSAYDYALALSSRKT